MSLENRRDLENDVLDAALVVFDQREAVRLAQEEFRAALSDGNNKEIAATGDALFTARLRRIGAEIEFRQAVAAMAKAQPALYTTG
jgi:hypothetical protein